MKSINSLEYRRHKISMRTIKGALVIWIERPNDKQTIQLPAKTTYAAAWNKAKIIIDELEG